MTTGRINQVSLLDNEAEKTSERTPKLLVTTQRKDWSQKKQTPKRKPPPKTIQSLVFETKDAKVPRERLASTLSFFGFLNLQLK